MAPPKPMGLLATVYKPDGRYIGRCGLYPLRTEEGIVVPAEARDGNANGAKEERELRETDSIADNTGTRE